MISIGGLLDIAESVGNGEVLEEGIEVVSDAVKVFGIGELLDIAESVGIGEVLDVGIGVVSDAVKVFGIGEDADALKVVAIGEDEDTPKPVVVASVPCRFSLDAISTLLFIPTSFYNYYFSRSVYLNTLNTKMLPFRISNVSSSAASWISDPSTNPPKIFEILTFYFFTYLET